MAHSQSKLKTILKSIFLQKRAHSKLTSSYMNTIFNTKRRLAYISSKGVSFFPFLSLLVFRSIVSSIDVVCARKILNKIKAGDRIE